MARPRFHPSDEQRRQVKSMAAFGMRETEIARLIGIRSPKTLRKHFRAELGRGAAEANGNVANALYKSRSPPVRPSRCRCRQTRWERFG